MANGAVAVAPKSFGASLKDLATSALKGAVAGAGKSFLATAPGRQVVTDQVTLETAKASRWVPWLVAGAAIALLVFLFGRR